MRLFCAYISAFYYLTVVIYTMSALMLMLCLDLCSLHPVDVIFRLKFSWRDLLFYKSSGFSLRISHQSAHVNCSVVIQSRVLYYDLY